MSPKLKRDRKLQWIPVELIIPNENNPRSKAHFMKEQLLPLRESIQEHGVLEPLLVQPYRDGPRDGLYLLLEGERRFSVARGLNLKEVPAVITDRLDDHDQLVVMFNMHANRKGWEMAEELNAIKLLKERNGHKSETEMAKELGITLQTYRNRLQVLGMGDDVVTDIARDKYDYTSALRVGEVTNSLGKRRPELVQKLGGEKAVKKKLLTKAKERGGISQELVEAKKDLADTVDVPDEVVEKYIEQPKATLRDVQKDQHSLVEKRKAETLARELKRVERDIRAFDVKLEDIPNLKQLREALGTLMDAATDLETRVVQVVMAAEK